MSSVSVEALGVCGSLFILAGNGADILLGIFFNWLAALGVLFPSELVLSVLLPLDSTHHACAPRPLHALHARPEHALRGGAVPLHGQSR